MDKVDKSSHPRPRRMAKGSEDETTNDETTRVGWNVYKATDVESNREWTMMQTVYRIRSERTSSQI